MLAPEPHLPAAQASPLVQGSPSSHVSLLAVAVQPIARSHTSVVHGLLSSQVTASPAMHLPPAHLSPWVHMLPSSQGAMLASWVQPAWGAQLSLVHSFLSSQDSGVATHLPSLQASASVHLLPSSHESAFGVAVHAPLAQVSSVQGLLSSHTLGLPALHAPNEQASASVQGSPSSQAALLMTWVQPLSPQLSSVQGLVSSHVFFFPVHAPATQASSVHASPSSHLAPSAAAAWSHLPDLGSQESTVHGCLSSHAFLGPALHAPSLHTSSVHLSPSASHEPALGSCWHLPPMQSPS